MSVVVAVAAQFLSEHYGAPAMLMALLLGIAFHFLAEEGALQVPGIEFTSPAPYCALAWRCWARGSASSLMIGLGAAADHSWWSLGVIVTILFRPCWARALLGRGWRFGAA